MCALRVRRVRPICIMQDFDKLFPNREAFIVFSLYIILFVFQGVFITASKSENGGYNYNTVLVVFLSELLKLVASAVLYTIRKEPTKPHIFKAIALNYRLLLLYFIPSMLYCFYNNLAFVNLSHYDPTSYYVLLQLRVVITALIFQVIFKTSLSVRQWTGLLVLTAGCMLKNFDAASIQSKNDTDLWSQVFNIYFLSINFQNVCSCLAGTYNEYLLKTEGANVDIFLQNVFMYLDSLICNSFIICFNSSISHVFKDLYAISNVFVILIIVNSAIVGIVTSFFLKNLNSILKTYASALELVITAVVCYLLFHIVITGYTIISICLVSIAVYMYFKNPVNNVQPESEVRKTDKIPLMEVVSD